MRTAVHVFRSSGFRGFRTRIALPLRSKFSLLAATIALCVSALFFPGLANAQQGNTAVRLYGAAAQPAYSQYGTAAFNPTRYTTYYGSTASPFQYVGYGYGMYRPWLYRPHYYYPYSYPYSYYGGYGLGYGAYGYGVGYGGFGLGYGGYGGLGLGYGGLGFGGYGYGYRPWYGGYGYPYSANYGPGYAAYGLGWGNPYAFGAWGLGGFPDPLGWGGYGGCYYW
jgi:hypothetical protein